MKFMFVLLAATLFASAGCQGPQDALQAHCEYVDLAEGRRYCSTTITEIMAHPRKFDSKDVIVRGWVARVGGSVYIFPHREYYGAGFAMTSIAFDLGSSDENLRGFLLAIEEDDPVMLTLGGRFELLRGKQPGTVMPRLGRLHEVFRAGP